MDAFSQLYAAVNAEWPQFGMEGEEADRQERRWRFALGNYAPESLQHAMKRALREAKKRPKVADLIEWADEHARTIPRMKREPAHWTKCPCHCGGNLWYLVLRDPITNEVRYHAQSVQAMMGALTAQLQRAPGVADAMQLLTGQPMTRVKCECKRTGGDPMPDHAFYLGVDEHGVPTFDAMRRPA